MSGAHAAKASKARRGTLVATHLLLVAVLVGATAPSAPVEGKAMPDLIPARDGNIAIRQELDAARRTATVDAYDLFIARHPAHPLAETARRERAELISRGSRPK